MIIYTIGHSTRSLDQFVGILKAHSIGIVADVRHFPVSRRFPHFNREELQSGLKTCGIGYVWMGKLLGGYRRGGYLAHTGTKEFREGIDELIRVSGGSRVAVMCAEALWFRCHRRYIADHLAMRGMDVAHISDQRRIYPHKMKDDCPDAGKERR